MFDFKRLDEKHSHDAAFNKAVNIFIQLIRDHGFMPSEIREAMFYAQYKYEMTQAQIYIRTDEERARFLEAVRVLRQDFADLAPEIATGKDLERIGELYGVHKKESEPDADYRERIKQKVKGG